MNKFFGGLWLTSVTLIFVLWWTLLEADPVIQNVMSGLNFYSEYEMFDYYNSNDFIEAGILSEFLTCIKGYEVNGARRKSVGEHRKLDLIINGKYKLKLNVFGGNVHSIEAVENLDLNDEKTSRYYRVNCDLNLLNEK